MSDAHTSATQGKWIWYELMTTDADASKAFYDAVVGWNIQTTHGDSNDYGFLVNTDGTMSGGLLHLTQEMRDHGARPIWLGYIAVDDVDAMLPKIEAAGGKTLMPPRDIEMAGRIAMVADCCGAPFYIMAPKPMPGMEDAESTAFSPTKIGSCAWNELVAGNQANAIAFYTSLFGWTEPREPMDMGEMGEYKFIAHNGVDIGAIMQKPPQMPVPMWNHYFRVPSIDAARAAVEANGGTVMMGPHEVPGGDWIIQGMDPQGAMFALVGGK